MLLQAKQVMSSSGLATGGTDDGAAATLDCRESLVAMLHKMAYETARGIHDAGWQRYGYWFATPEAWEQSGEGSTCSTLCIRVGFLPT
jgi:hypothetical protein